MRPLRHPINIHLWPSGYMFPRAGEESPFGTGRLWQGICGGVSRPSFALGSRRFEVSCLRFLVSRFALGLLACAVVSCLRLVGRLCHTSPTLLN